MPALTQTSSVTPRPTAWSGAVTLNQVDPASGIQSLTLSLTGTEASTVSVINYDLVPAVFDSTTYGSVTLARPDGAPWLFAAPDAALHGTLPAAPASGAAPVLLSSAGSATSSVGFHPAQTSSADAALLLGTGQVSLPVTASARLHATGPGNLSAQFTSQAGADVSLTAATANGDTGAAGSLQAVYFVSPNIGLIDVFGGTLLTKTQTLTAADALTGAATALSFDPFNPALGKLQRVNIRVSADASGTAQIENLDPVAGSATLGAAASVTVSGTDGTAIATSSASFTTTRQLAAFDGTADFGGASASAITEAASGARLTSGAGVVAGTGLAAYQSGPVTLTVARTGVTTLDAPGNFDVNTALQAGATVTVTYSYYAPTPPATVPAPSGLSYTDTATHGSGTLTGDAYAGPVAGLAPQYIWASPDGVALSWAASNVFLHGGAGDDALAVSGGSNVLDGGTGSNFLVGASGADGGHDTFFVDARGAGTTWSTVANFHAGDVAAVFGFHAGTSTMPLAASDGVAGYTGLTLHSETAGAGTGVNASLTFAGITQAAADAHFTFSTGTIGAGTSTSTDYLLIQWDH